jgi:hypothetical protein
LPRWCVLGNSPAAELGRALAIFVTGFEHAARLDEQQAAAYCTHEAAKRNRKVHFVQIVSANACNLVGQSGRTPRR